MVLQSLDSLTPQWLTEKLTAKGALITGAVTRIEQDDQTFNRGAVAEVVRLKVTYSDGAAGSLPQNLILKIPRADLHPELLTRGAHEVRFYQAVEQAGLDLPVAACYDAAYDETSQRSHILMQDISGTHYQRPLPIPPSYRQCRGIIENCARVHAAWWNSPRLGSEIGERLTLKKADAMEQRLMHTLPAFFDYLGDALLPAQRKAIEDIVSSDFLGRLSRRLCDLRQVTLIHGDAHTGNMLLPRDEQGQRVIFIDWQLWGINVAAIDLAFLMGLHWNAERRAAWEKPLLEHYYQHLLANGVSGYRFEDLWRDYRESIVVMCLIPIGQFRRKSPAGVVWFGLQDSLAAYHDLRCAEVLGE